jgi:pimeloyl-ACP methyl ester carboxylesterase
MERRHNVRRGPVSAGWRIGFVVGALLVVSGCATPVGVTRVNTQTMYKGLTASVLSTGRPSQYSEHLLIRLGLAGRFDEEPEAVLAGLRGPARGLSREYLFVLSELSFLHAAKSQKPEYYLGSAVYAWAFLFGKPGELEADPLDPRVRLAANLYNVGLAQGLGGPDGESVEVESGSRRLPFGNLDVTVDPRSLVWSGYKMSRFVAVGEFKVRGVLNRYHQAGIGAPLAAELTAIGDGPEAEAARKRIPPRLKVPVTALLRLPNVFEGLASGQMQGEIEIYAADVAETAEVGGRRVPLELEPTAALAYQLEGAPIWDTELASFFSALRPPSPVSLGMLHPYRPGKVPVVLIHGTASSPARWADMVNELQNDPKLKDRIDFWLFTYNTSNPILLSASELRTSLRRILSELDPLGRDPALRQVVLIGHSQGGLLARLMVTDSGERFWAATTEVPFEQVKARPETRELIERTIFFQPLPFVSRVVFVCTPHQGSFRSSSLVLGLLRRLIRLPATLRSSAHDLSAQNESLGGQVLSDVPNAVENMRPGHRFVKTLSASPIAPGVSVHSIVAVPEAGPPAGQTDGVVAYESAHLEGVGSEKIVRSHHSAQGNPATILEVRRILYEHLGIPCGLECEVVDRVDAAAAAMEKPERPEVETEWAERP